MAFDFPDAPAVGDIFTSAGVDYQYAGNGVWNLASGGTMTDYVLKAGDTMTVGPLIAVSPAHFRCNSTDPAHGAVRLSGGSVDRTGMVEWFMGDQRKARLGWGLQHVDFVNENGNKGLFMVGGGLHWGTDTAQTDPLVFDRGICLYGYGGTSQFGFTITSGTLNYVVQSTVNQHCFRVGAEDVMNVKSDGVRIPGGNLSVSGKVSIRDGDQLDMSNGYYVKKEYGTQNMFFHAGQSNGQFVFHITGFGNAFIIDKVGSTGNSVNVTAPEARAVARELGIVDDDERGVDVMLALAACVAKMKSMDAEIAALKRARA